MAASTLVAIKRDLAQRQFDDHLQKNYIYVIYARNLGLQITLPGREREQGRFRGSTGGAPREHGGATEGVRGSSDGALWGSAGALL